MHLKILNSLLLSAFLGSCAYANDILSPNQNKAIELSKEKLQYDSDALKNDWIEPIVYTYSYNDKDVLGKDKTSVLAINQPIFRSGGIYSAIDYANNLKESSNISIQMQKQELIKQALNLAYTIKITELQIEQQKLALQNAKIDLRVKKESVMNGLLDTSFLNNAILTLNSQKGKLLEMQYSKKAYINSFSNLSNKDPHTLDLPKFKKLESTTFQSKNLELQKYQSDTKVKKAQKGSLQAQYLPSVNLNYSITKDHYEKNYNYNHIAGFNIRVPLDINSFDSIDSLQIEYLQAKNDLDIKKQSEINFFESQNLKLEMLDSKIKLSRENISSYNELLTQMEELANVGLKTSDDVTILANSKKTEELNLDILEYQKQIELLEIYGKLNLDKI